MSQGSKELLCNFCNSKYTYKTSSGKSRNFCPSCQERRKRYRKRMWIVKNQGNKCKNCGWSGCYRAFNFHHTDDKNINLTGRKSYKQLYEEAQKCELLCASCHKASHCKNNNNFCPTHTPEITCNCESTHSGSCKVQRLRWRRKKKLIENFGGECENCGYDNCYSSLEFHHINPKEKEFKLDMSNMTKTLEELKIEASKCRLICSTCHEREHCTRCCSEKNSELLMDVNIENIPERVLPTEN